MTILLPQLEAGKISVGSDARIVLDVLPHQMFKAQVSFVADKAQFTPKEVETKIYLVADVYELEEVLSRFPELLVIQIGLIIIVAEHLDFRIFEGLNPIPRE